MRVFNRSGFYVVQVTRREVETFRQSWPCSGLRRAPLTFEFSTANGDLLDSNDQERHPRAAGAALVALAEDAGRYGAKRLRLPLDWRHS